MKIDATSSIYATQRYRMIGNRTAVQENKKQGNDDIEISGEAVSFAKAFGAAKAGLEKNGHASPRVESIRNMVASGTYKVEAEQIADSILMYI